MDFRTSLQLTSIDDVVQLRQGRRYCRAAASIHSEGQRRAGWGWPWVGRKLSGSGVVDVQYCTSTSLHSQRQSPKSSQWRCRSVSSHTQTHILSLYSFPNTFSSAPANLRSTSPLLHQAHTPDFARLIEVQGDITCVW